MFLFGSGLMVPHYCLDISNFYLSFSFPNHYRNEMNSQPNSQWFFWQA